jgi:hypothetical protein
MPQLLPDGLLDPAAADAVVTSVDAAISYGETWQFDFAEKRLVVSGGRVHRVGGVDCLMQWMRCALMTERFRWPIYGSGFGTEFARMVEESVATDEAQGQITTEITEALEFDPRIAEVSLITFSVDDEEPAAVVLEIEVKTFDAKVDTLRFDIELEV